MTNNRPLDHPTPARPHRVYLALTNRCNRRCPWCSTCSTPERTTDFDPAQLAALLPDGMFELQLEGGEPTIHPQFWSIINYARAQPRCTRVVLCTNGVVLPRQRGRLRDYLDRLGAPLTLKLSFNHHLLEHDPGLVELARLCRELVPDFVLNVRLRPGLDEALRAQVEAAGLLPHANVFYLQRYGFASDELDWELPFLAGDNFRLVNPDGALFHPDPAPAGDVLIRRSEAMRVLP